MTDQDVEQLIEAELGYWVSLRKSLHFPHDQETVKKIARRKEARATLEEAGFPLTTEEQKEMEIRSAIGSESSDLHESGIAKEEWYGGGYLDHETGQVVITIKGDIPNAERAKLVGSFSHPDRVSFVPVTHSYSELAEAASKIEAIALQIDDLSAIAVDVIRNGVHVGVDDPGLQQRSNERISALVASQTDVKTIVEYEPASIDAACFNRSNCATVNTEEFRGGLKLLDPPGTGFCTTGFMARAKDNANVRLIATAGHCDDDVTDRDRTVGGQTVGAFAFTGGNTMRNGANWTTTNQDADAAAFQVSNARYGNRIYKNDSFKSWFINDTDNWNNQNELVCVSGQTLNYRCGLVAYSTQSSPGGSSTTGVTLTRQMKFDIVRVGWNLPAVQGSSGGPVTGSPSYNHTKRDALGLLARATANSETMEDGLQVTKNRLVVSRIGFVERDLNVWIQTSAP